jgi:hypothetical protein
MADSYPDSVNRVVAAHKTDSAASNRPECVANADSIPAAGPGGRPGSSTLPLMPVAGLPAAIAAQRQPSAARSNVGRGAPHANVAVQPETGTYSGRVDHHWLLVLTGLPRLIWALMWSRHA